MPPQTGSQSHSPASASSPSHRSCRPDGSIRLRGTTREAASAARRSAFRRKLSLFLPSLTPSWQLPTPDLQLPKTSDLFGSWELEVGVDHHITTPPPTRSTW